jgi:hypothetical protein
MKNYLAIRIHGEPHVLVAQARGIAPLDPAQSLRLVNHSPNGFEWGYGGSGPAQLALAILLDLTGDAGRSEHLHQPFKWKFIASAPKGGFRLTEDEIWAWISTVQPDVPIKRRTFQTQQEVIQEIQQMIDPASFRQCYERRDPRIRQFVVVAPDCSLAEVAAQLFEGAPERKALADLTAEGKVTAVLPDVRLIIEALANPGGLTPEAKSLEAYLEPRMEREVEAFYSPPLYFVRFTGRPWD